MATRPGTRQSFPLCNAGQPHPRLPLCWSGRGPREPTPDPYHPAGPGDSPLSPVYAHWQHKRLPLPRTGQVACSRSRSPSIPRCLGRLGGWLLAGLGALPAETRALPGPPSCSFSCSWRTCLAHLQDDSESSLKSCRLSASGSWMRCLRSISTVCCPAGMLGSPVEPVCSRQQAQRPR